MHWEALFFAKMASSTMLWQFSNKSWHEAQAVIFDIFCKNQAKIVTIARNLSINITIKYYQQFF